MRACASSGSRASRRSTCCSVARVALHPAGFAALDPRRSRPPTDDRHERLLARVAACIWRLALSGAARPGAAGPAASGARARSRQRARTLGGCRFVPWRGRLLVMRELAAASSAARLATGRQPSSGTGVSRRISPAECTRPGDARLSRPERRRGAPERYSGDVPRLVHPVLPAFWDGRASPRCRLSAIAGPGSRSRHGLCFGLPTRFHKPGFTVV